MVDEFAIIGVGHNEDSHKRGACSEWSDPRIWGGPETCQFSADQYVYDLGRCDRLPPFTLKCCPAAPARCVVPTRERSSWGGRVHIMMKSGNQ